MNHLDRDGVGIAWNAVGSGPAMLLTHGYMASAHMWASNIDALAESHTVITWDMRGHGQTDYPPDVAQYSVPLSVGDMAAILDEVGVERAVMVGMSLGGYLTLAFQLAHPERTAGMVLVDTGPGFKRDEARQAWNETSEGRARGFEEKGLGYLEPDRAEVSVESHRDASGLILAARGILMQHDDRVIRSLVDVAVPTLVIVGERDERFLAGCAYMAAKIPGAQHVIIPGAGHASNIDCADVFNETVLSFLEDNEL